MINNSNLEEVRKLIKKESKPILVKAQNDNFNRIILEYGKFDALVFPSKSQAKENIRQINSSFNEVLSDIAKKNNISICYDLEEIRQLSKKEKSLEISNMKQNIILCRKSKISFKLINYHNKISAFSLLITLGASTQQAKEAFLTFKTAIK